MKAKPSRVIWTLPVTCGKTFFCFLFRPLRERELFLFDIVIYWFYTRSTKAKHEYKSVEKTETSAADVHVHHERVQIPAEEAVSIFVSIGKNRRVFPRDLVGLLIAVGGLERDRIGDIKVLANYSFVQLYANDAQTAIDKLNGYDYRGRKLAVSFSRQKSDDDLADDADVDETAEEQYSEEDAEMSAEDAAAYAAAEKAASDKEPFGLN